MRGWIWLRVLSVCALVAAFPMAAKAANDQPQAPSAWTFDGGFYAWALWVEGNATTRGLNVDVYADPVDLIDALDGPIIMGNFEAKRGPFALYVDVVYAKFGLDEDFIGSVQPFPALTLKGNARIGADYEFGVYEAYGFYQVARSTGPNSTTTFELGGGARWVRQELDLTLGLDLSANLNLGRFIDVSAERELAFANSGLMEWVDPVVAARTKHTFGNGHSVTAMGNIGGFDTNDDFTWEAVLTYDCDGKLFGYDTTTSLGYKALGLLFEESTSRGARGVDVVLHGPVAEVKFRW